MSDQFRRAFSPGAIGRLRLPHRIIMGAMHLGLESLDDGGAALAAFYAERARGGAGLMVTGGAAVSQAGAGGPRYGTLHDTAFTRRLAHVAERVHDAGGLIALQLFHAGRYAPASEAGPVAPSPVLSRISGCEPRELSGIEIDRTLADFGHGAALARSLGFDAVEIMGSEGYLIDQFLSPLTNRRNDEWGGDPDRRSRFGVEVMLRVRAAAGDGFPVIFRMSGADLMDGGVPPEHVIGFARAVTAAGADSLNIGIGWHESPVPTVQAIVPPGTWAPVAAAVKAAAGAVPVIASNRVSRLSIAETILDSDQADFASMARPFLADPRLISSARDGRGVNMCVGCNQACIDRALADDGDTVSCMVNPRTGRELALPYPARVSQPSRVAVLGGGPAGLSAARDLAAVGHRVTLFESADALGGQFRLAARVPGKEDYAESVRYLAGELAGLGAEIILGQPADGEQDLLRAFDGVIVATGVRPRPLAIPGAGLPHVAGYRDAFTPSLGDRVVIVGGGGIAVDVAHYASHPRSGRSRSVTIACRGARIGTRLGKSTRWAVLGALRERGVALRSGVRCERIMPHGVEITDSDGGRELLPADTVVIAIGQVADDSVMPAVRRSGVWHRVIGGARDAAGLDAVRAMAEGARAAGEFATGRGRA